MRKYLGIGAASVLIVVAACGAGGGGGTTGGGTSGGGTGATWTNATANLAGLNSECGNMSFLSARPDRDMLIAGIALKGLWAMNAGATSWTQLGQGAGSAVITNRPSSITYDAAHPDTFWESGLYNGAGAYRTDDN